MKTTSAISFAALFVLFICVTSIRTHPLLVDRFANFIVANGKTVSEEGSIMNAALSWGKWQQGDEDVTTVNYIGFNTAKAASFRASGRDGSPSGAEGTFDIYEGGRRIALVEFSIPFWGGNEVKIHEFDDQFVCNQKGLTAKGSPTINIKCHRIPS
ncbi:unnamed protein product, partial [Iphiclides podalirius]